MFQAVSLMTFLVVLGGIVIHCLAAAVCKRYKWRPMDILRTLVHLFTLLFVEQKTGTVGALRKVVYLLAMLCFVILFVTGFYPVLVHGEHLSGYLLMIHATFAPVFAVCLAILAVMWADRCRFDENYLPWLGRILGQPAKSREPIEKYELLRKVCFWLILVLSLPVILSIVLSMFPVFGTCGQEFLLSLHGYSTLVFAIVVIIHTYLAIWANMHE